MEEKVVQLSLDELLEDVEAKNRPKIIMPGDSDYESPMEALHGPTGLKKPKRPRPTQKFSTLPLPDFYLGLIPPQPTHQLPLPETLTRGLRAIPPSTQRAKRYFAMR